jgi:hypothetical protein
MLIKFIQIKLDEFVSHFGFDNISDFCNSLVHPKLLLFTLPTTILGFSLFSFIEKWLGLSYMVFVAFIVALILELVTGLAASIKKGVKISSTRFSRFGLKVMVWMGLMLITNSFQLSYLERTDIVSKLTYNLFYFIHGMLVVYICIEYMISILENLSVITGQKENKFLNFLKKKVDQWIGFADDVTTPKLPKEKSDTKED